MTAIRVTYDVTLEQGETAAARARDIALEQTVELPEGRYPAAIGEQIVGRVESASPTERGRARLVIAYAPAIVSGNLLGLLNLVFGNISLKRGIRVVDVELPPDVLGAFRGPAFGIAGLRQLSGAPARPLLCGAAKPVGLSVPELAARCGQFAEAGVDFVKDDHSLADQPMARFDERVCRSLEAVAAANARSGGRTVYLPNLIPGDRDVFELAAIAADAGCEGVVLSPWLVGLDVTRRLAAEGRLVVFAHPTFSGALLGKAHGMAPDVLYGLVGRLAGCDAVIYPNAGGRFPFSEATCQAINRRLRAPLGALAPAMPVAGGGVAADSVAHWVELYGTDLTFLIGSSFYAADDPVAACHKVVEVVHRFT